MPAVPQFFESVPDGALCHVVQIYGLASAARENVSVCRRALEFPESRKYLAQFRTDRNQSLALFRFGRAFDGVLDRERHFDLLLLPCPNLPT